MNKKLALFLTCCAVAGLSACNESVPWSPSVFECIDNSMACQDGNVTKCTDGHWVTSQVCQGTATPFCDSTTYTCTANVPSACTEGNKLCENNALKTCVNGTWVLYNCGNGTCDSTTLSCTGQDVPVIPSICTPGCNKSELTTCANGTATKTTCSGDTPVCDPYAINGPACVKAEDAKECVASAKKCEDVSGVPTAYVCDSDGKWDAGTACEDGQICSDNICADEPAQTGCEYTDSNSEKKTLKDGDVICDGTLRVTCTGTQITTDDCSDDGIDFTCSTASGAAICVSPAGCEVEGSETLAKHGDKMCKDSEIVMCDDGRWITSKDCANDEDGKVACLDAQCVACLDDDKKCEVAEGVHTLYTCENNEWKGTACETGLVCDTAKPSTSCVNPLTLMSCDDIEGGNGSKCMDIHDQNYAVFCMGGTVNEEYTENCTSQSMICDYTSNNPECIEIPDGCKPENDCNDEVIKDITCGNHFNDMYASGTVKCDALCSAIDYSECLYCGDGKITSTPNSEQCDGENIGEATCADVESLDKNKTYTGKPGCENCMLTVGTCVESGGEQPQTGYTSIKQIRDDYDNIKDGKGLESTDIKGVVTASGSKGFTIQDPDGSENIAGVYVYCSGDNCPAFPAVGKYVNVKSTVAVTHYNGLVEVTGNKETLTITELEGAATATALDKTIADIIADGAKNAYASMLVTIKNVEVSAIELKNDKNYNVTLKSGDSTTLVTNSFGGQAVLDPFAQDFLYNVTGVVYNNNKNYIGPRTAADIVISGCKDPNKTFNGNQAAPECTTGGGGENNKACKGLDDVMTPHDQIGCIDATTYSICNNGVFAEETKDTCPNNKKYCNKASQNSNDQCVQCLEDSHCAGDNDLHVVGICVSNACDIKCASTYAYDKQTNCSQISASFVSINEGKAYAQINQSKFPDNTVKSASFLCTTDKTKALSAWTKVTTTVNANYNPNGGDNVEYMADLSALKGNNFCTFTFVVDDVTYIAEKESQSWVPVAASASYKFPENANLWTYEGQGGGGNDNWVTIVEAPDKYIAGTAVSTQGHDDCKDQGDKDTKATCDNNSSNVGESVPSNGMCVKPTTNWACGLGESSNPSVHNLTTANVHKNGYLLIGGSWPSSEDFSDSGKYMTLTLSDSQISALAGKTKIRAKFNCKKNGDKAPSDLVVAFFNGDTKLGNAHTNTISTTESECVSEEVALSSTSSLNLRITAWSETSTSTGIQIFPITIEAK
ncbi:MAG: hypothetical protein IJ268_05570 [Proteobacteria bacterium]|nr:hypothetical protein [Pseudomonadota bacterium]